MRASRGRTERSSFEDISTSVVMAGNVPQLSNKEIH
jgi:hypothetical protein